MENSESLRIRMAGEQAMVLVITAEPEKQLVSAICGLMAMVSEVAMQIAELREDFRKSPAMDVSKFN
jgi:hypothetical protein